MFAENFEILADRLRCMVSDVGELRRVVDGEALAVSDRQYLTRCLDLLDMEIGALRDYLQGLHSSR